MDCNVGNQAQGLSDQKNIGLKSRAAVNYQTWLAYKSDLLFRVSVEVYLFSLEAFIIHYLFCFDFKVYALLLRSFVSLLGRLWSVQ